MDLGAATRELFELPPAEFTAERDKLAAEARRAGTRGPAAAIKALRRPTTSAWLANLLVRQRQDLVAELVALGAAMRNAQASLAAGDMRALAAVRRRLIAALVAEAGALATERGQSLTRAGQEELEATFEAAVADEGAAGALRSGRLARPLSYTGLGPVDLAGALSAPPAPGSAPGDSTAPVVTRGPGAPGDQETGLDATGRLATLGALEDELRQAGAAAAQAAADLAEAQRRARLANEVLGRYHQQSTALEHQLSRLRLAQDQAGADLGQAQLAVDAAGQLLDGAARRLALAEGAFNRRQSEARLPG